MDGIQYFRDCCAKVNVDCDELFKLSSGKSEQNRFSYACPYHTRRETQLYAIRYFMAEDLYIAWDLKIDKFKKQSKFTLSKNAVEVKDVSVSNPVYKGIEFSWKSQEPVMVFKPKDVTCFLETILNRR